MYVDYKTPDKTVSNVDAIDNSIKNILRTKKGSMPGKPNFGSLLHTVIFNQLDHITINTIKTIIEDALDNLEPRVVINNIDIKDIPEYNRIVASISYDYIEFSTGNTITNTTKINLNQ